MLEILGLDELAEAAYFAVLNNPPLTLEELAARTGAQACGVEEALGRLVSRGLIASLPGPAERYLALPPEHALEVLLLATERDIRLVRSAAPQLGEQHRRMLTGQAPLVEVITGAAAVARCGQQLFRRAKTQIRGIDAPPYAQFGDGQRVNSSRALGADGRVRIRFIHGRAAFDQPGTAARVEADIAAGEDVRFLPSAPIKMIIADGSAALLPLVTTPDVLDSCILVRPSSLLDALATLFETLWEAAQPFVADRPGDACLNGFASDEERQIISLLAIGLSDDAIARQLGVGYRTVQRRVQGVLRRLGAASRFQAGVLAARRGWWEPDEPARPGQPRDVIRLSG